MRIETIFVIITLLILISIGPVSSESASVVNVPTNTPSLSSSSSSSISNPPEAKKLWGEKELCEYVKGCFDGHFCYPFGFRKDGQYCYAEQYPRTSVYVMAFAEQSSAKESCSYDFQCESNFCFNGQCVDEIEQLIVDLDRKIKNLENRMALLEGGEGNVVDVALTEEELNDANQNNKRLFSILKRIFT